MFAPVWGVGNLFGGVVSLSSLIIILSFLAAFGIEDIVCGGSFNYVVNQFGDTLAFQRLIGYNIAFDFRAKVGRCNNTNQMFCDSL